MEKSDVELKGTPLLQIRVNSTFDCYLDCIKNSQCQFAEFKNTDDFGVNCSFKTDVENSEIDSDDNDGREFYKLKSINIKF